jgi:hypothetical protein
MSVVKAVLKGLHSPDARDLDTFSPPDPKCFRLLLQAMFGSNDAPGEESFDILVCTPAWLALEVERKGKVSGRHYLIVREFNLSMIKSFLTDLARDSVGQTWEEVAEKLSRVGKWEFEDYQL